MDAQGRGHPLLRRGISSVKRYVAAAREGRSLAPKKRPGSKPKMDEGARRLLEADLEERPAASLPERREFLRRACGVSGQRLDDLPPGAEAAGVEQKKRSVGASERDEWLRATWRAMVAAATEPERLVFIDEMGTNTSLAPLHAWSRRGERARFEVPRNWGANVTLLASMGAEGMGPCLAAEGATTKAVFEAYLERVLAPSLRPGQVVAMDNLSAHKGDRVRGLIEERGCEVVFLPPYSPDFDPIEEAFSKVKGALRKAKARTLGALFEATHRALGAVSPKDARGFFSHRGYGPPQAHSQ